MAWNRPSVSAVCAHLPRCSSVGKGCKFTRWGAALPVVMSVDEMVLKPSKTLDSSFAYLRPKDWSKRYGAHIYTVEFRGFVASKGRPEVDGHLKSKEATEPLPVDEESPSSAYSPGLELGGGKSLPPKTLYRLVVRAGRTEWTLGRRCVFWIRGCSESLSHCILAFHLCFSITWFCADTAIFGHFIVNLRPATEKPKHWI